MEDAIYSMRKVFLSDEKLASTYHILSGHSMEECIQNTTKTIQDADSMVYLSYYVCEVGYAIFYDNILYSFGINKEDRTQENKEEFFKFVKSMSDTCFLWKKNERAIRFMNSIGFNLIEEMEIENKKYVKLCQ
jgi:hypothetical protein